MPLDPTRTVHVKDLHFDVQEQELFSHFSSVGQVASVKLHRDRQSRQSLGFAFVTFYHPMHASAAVAQLHYSTIRGQPIVVMWVGEHEALDPDANLFIRNLDHSITNDQLYELFASYGRVISAKIMIDSNTQLSKRYGYVQFQFAADAQSAMTQLQGYTFGQYQLQIVGFRPKGVRYSTNTNTKNTGYDGDVPYGNSYDGSTNDGAYDEVYRDMYDQSSAYNERAESYYYDDNSSTMQGMTRTNQIPPNLQSSITSASTVSSVASSYSGTSTVNIRVIDDAKGTLSDLSPSAPEWKPTLPGSSNPSSISALSSSLKPDSPVFIPGGSNSKSKSNSNSKLTVSSVPASTGTQSSALYPNSTLAAAATVKKLSPNASAWTGAMSNATFPASSTTASTTSHSNATKTVVNGKASTQSTAVATSMGVASGPHTSVGNSEKTSPKIPILTSTSGATLPSSPLLSTLASPLAASSSMSSTLPTSVISSSTTTSTSTFLSSGLSSFSSGFPASNSLLSFPLSLSSNATASIYTTEMGTSLSTASKSSSLLLPMLPSSPSSSFPFSDGEPSSFATLHDASASGLSGVAPSSPAPSSSSSRVLLNATAHTDTLPSVVSPFPFHFSLAPTSSTFPLSPSSPFPLSGSTRNSSSSSASSILFASASAGSTTDLQARFQQLSTTLLANSLDAQEGMQRLLMGALLLQSLSSGSSSSALTSTPKAPPTASSLSTTTRTTPGAGLFPSSSTHAADSVRLELELSSSPSSTLPPATAPFSPNRPPARDSDSDSDSFQSLLNSLTPSSLPALEHLLAHLGRVVSQLESRRTVLSLQTMPPPESMVTQLSSCLEIDHGASHPSHSLLRDMSDERWNA